MKMLVEVNMDNAAFEDDPAEITRVLHKAGDFAFQMMHGGNDKVKLQDINGNTVGFIEKVENDYP